MATAGMATAGMATAGMAPPAAVAEVGCEWLNLESLGLPPFPPLPNAGGFEFTLPAADLLLPWSPWGWEKWKEQAVMPRRADALFAEATPDALQEADAIETSTHQPGIAFGMGGAVGVAAGGLVFGLSRGWRSVRGKIALRKRSESRQMTGEMAAAKHELTDKIDKQQPAVEMATSA